MKAAFACRLRDFGATTLDAKLAALNRAAAASGHATQYLRQVSAWDVELELLGNCAAELLERALSTGDWCLLLEYPIPRRSKRPDMVLIAHDLIFVIEFKIGVSNFESADEWQVLSYGLDLQDFHAESNGRDILPILVLGGPGVGHDSLPPSENVPGAMRIQRVRSMDGWVLARFLLAAYNTLHKSYSVAIDPLRWEASSYRPSPNIIEAAESLFAGHSVEEISHRFATNLEATSERLLQAIRQAQQLKQRIICFVTGTPGAGKTLAGLNAVHNPAMRHDDRPSAVFLSGNGPLVNVVREALIRNRVRSGAQKRDAKQAVSAFINNVHGFLELYGIDQPTRPPHEHAVIFDEAQRAWDAAKVQSKRGLSKSEPQLILEIMERANDWCVVVAIVGGGQEIHSGEAGLAEWGRALNSSSTQWHVLVSREALVGAPSVAGNTLFSDAIGGHLTVNEVSDLHLDTGVRSPRAHWLVDWVNGILAGEPVAGVFDAPTDPAPFPIVLTRSLDRAKQWLRAHAEGVQRCGLLASSGALRLRAHGIEVSPGFRKGYNFAEWFLGPPDDCRSSFWLEVAGTEFECQGLELEWTGVCWGGDFIYVPDLKQWFPRQFRGKRWKAVCKASERQFVLNKYRVLLTRARRGMVIWVPHGDKNDATRAPEEFDSTAAYLISCGLTLLD